MSDIPVQASWSGRSLTEASLEICQIKSDIGTDEELIPYFDVWVMNVKEMELQNLTDVVNSHNTIFHALLRSIFRDRSV